MKRFNVALICLLSGCIALAQETPSEYLSAYSGEFAVRLKDHTTVTIEVKKDKLDIRENYDFQTLFLDNQASAHGSVTLEYEPEFFNLEDLRAYTLSPSIDKDKYEKLKVKDVADKELMAEDIFYSGRRAKIFEYPGMKKGSITCLSYTQVHALPYLLGAEIFNEHILRASHRLQIIHDEEVTMDFSYFNCDADDFNYTREVKSGQVINTWIPKVYSKIRPEDGMPSLRTVAPHIVYRIVSYKIDGEEVPVLKGAADLYNWYNSLLTEVRKDVCLPLQALTDSIVKGAIDDNEKTRKIFNWVQNNIKYIAFENGIEGFQPRLPSEIFQKRFGDCKDMSSLMVNMLQHAGIESYHTWIGTRDLPYTYKEVPSPLTDNHMIVTAIVDGDYIFLDATNSSLPYPLPSSFIQGKEALIGMGEDKFVIQTVPVVPSEQNRLTDSVWVNIEGSKIYGSGRRSFTGYFADQINSSFTSKDKEWISERLKARVQKGNNKCLSTNHQLLKEDKATSISYDFEVADYAFENENQLLLNLNLEKHLSTYSLKDDRIYPRENMFAYRLNNVYSVQIPEGYEVTYLPDDFTFPDNKDFSVELKYNVTEDTIHYTLLVDVNHLVLEKDRFARWNEMIKNLNRNYSETIILTKKL